MTETKGSLKKIIDPKEVQKPISFYKKRYVNQNEAKSYAQHNLPVKMNEALLSSEFLEPYTKLVPPWGFNGLGYIVFKRTYARIKPDGTTEEWWETIQRCIEGAQKIGAQYTRAEAERLFDHMFNLRCNLAGRMLWQLGTSTVDRFGANSLLNCWFVSINELRAFEFLFENLMLGGGVGFSIRREDVHELPRVKKGVIVNHLKTNDAEFIVPDSREGWVKLLHHVLRAFFITGKSFTYSTILIRPRGEPIKGFGGTASGPIILIEGMEKIATIIRAREDKKLRSIDALDIANIIGSIVVAGNVRRSAQIALGDPDDMLFLRAKRWDLGIIPNWRAMSNNTIYADNYDHIMENVWDGYAGNGEPYGFFNLPLSRKFGRLGEECKDNCEGTNPCGEISLASYESCNLSELYLNNISSQKQLADCAKLLYKTQKAVAALPYIHEETTTVVRKHMRLGLGITGVCQSLEKLNWLNPVYKELKEFDKEWSKKRGWNESLKLTTLKPSGTSSLLAGATPGVGTGISEWYIRRIRMSSTDSLVQTCRDAGFYVEYAKNFDGSEDHDMVVVEFPCHLDNAVLAADMPAVRQLDLVKQLQTIWSDNAVSVTVYYKKEELSAIREWMREHYKTSLKSVSFLLHSDHGFAQAPYEPITKDEYGRRMEKISKIKQITTSGKTLEALECEKGICPIR